MPRSRHSKLPAIVPIHEVGRHEQNTYIVYEFISGPTLAELLRQTRPSLRQAAEWIAGLGEALDDAHQCGVVHRDVKPGNVLLQAAESGGQRVEGQNIRSESSHDASLALRTPLSTLRPLLTDFGLALHADAGATLTQEGDILGTPAYMPPEQAKGLGHEADARSDVYALGVMLYELLCGRPPFQGGGASILHKVIHEEPTQLHALQPGVPLDLETICLEAMAKEPQRRYQSAGTMAEDLRRFLNNEPILARRVGPVGRLALWCRRNPMLAATIALALVALTALGSLSYWRVVQERNRAQANLYRALVDGTRAELQGRDTAWWWKAMDNIRQAALLNVPASDPADLRALAIECIGTASPCFRLSDTWTGHEGSVLSLAMSPDGERVATGSRDQTVRIWNAHSGKSLAILHGHGDAVLSVAFHPEGRLVASGSSDGTVRMWDLNEPGTRTNGSDESDAGVLLMDLDQPVHQLAFRPDGRVLAAACHDHRVALWDFGDRLSKAPRKLGAEFHAMTPSRQPSPRAAGGEGRVRGAASDLAPQLLPGHSGAVWSVVWSPDGRYLASGSEQGVVILWDGQAFARVVTLRGETGQVRSLAFSPDGQLLAAAGYVTPTIVWDLARLRRTLGEMNLNW